LFSLCWRLSISEKPHMSQRTIDFKHIQLKPKPWNC
jgi:hypothetical protein